MNTKTSRRSSRSLTGKALAPFALAALVAQGCGLEDPSPASKKDEPAEQGTTGTGTGASSSAATSSSSGTGSVEEAPETSGEETGSAAEENTDSSKEDDKSSDTTKEDASSSSSDASSTEDSSSSSSTTSSGEESTESTEEEDPAPDEKGDDKVELTWIETGVQAQLIGLDARNTRNIWVGGQNGTMMQSRDNGETWTRVLVSDNAADSELEFRDVEIVDMRTIYALAAGKGEKSRIYKSSNAGRTWTEQFKAEEEDAFINCMDFFDRNNGIVYGDSFDKAHYMLRTRNGRTWDRIDAKTLPEPLADEGGYSASGSCAVALDRNTFMAATGGGETARVLRTEDRGKTWEAIDVPVHSGNKDRGMTSLVMWSKTEGVALATDIADDATEVPDAVAYTKDGGKTWEKRSFTAPQYGFFGGAANSDGSFIIGVSPMGMHYSTDKGETWTEVSRRNLWTVKFADDKTAFAAGAEGVVVRITIK